MEHHPHLAHRQLVGSPKAADLVSGGFNGRLSELITRAVGTLWAFYVFTALSLVSLPSVLKSGSAVVIVAWIAQTFLQLVLLAVLQTSSNRNSLAGDARALATFNDAEAIIHTLLQVEQHLLAQDAKLADLITARA